MKRDLPGDSSLPPGVTNRDIDRRGRELMNMHTCECCDNLIRSNRTLCNRCERDQREAEMASYDPQQFDEEEGPI